MSSSISFVRKVSLAVAGSALLGSAPVLAQESEKRDPTFSVALNQDSFFGFYPTFNGAVPVGEKIDFTFYGIFWTKPAFGLTPLPTGDNLWTEFGVGVNFLAADGRLSINPQLGITNGSLLSGGDIDEDGVVTGARLFDGIVPSLTVNYNDEKFQAQFYMGYYAALRQRGGDAALDFLHLWVNGGYKFSSLVSGGLHYEYLSNTRNTYPLGGTGAVYQWIGPYVQFTLPKGFFARFTGGADVQSGNTGDFYKMSVGMSF